MDMCAINSFDIKSIDATLEFNCLKPYLLGLINLIDKDSHARAAKRAMRIVKERALCEA